MSGTFGMKLLLAFVGFAECVTTPVSVPMVKKIGNQQLSFKWEE